MVLTCSTTRGFHAHVDDLLQHDPANARAANRWELSAGVLVPIYGSYELEHRVYGSVRPTAIVLDWILGGLVPAGLATASFVVHEDSTCSWLRWAALGFYGVTRLGVLIVGNLHISEYDNYLTQQRASGSVHVLAASWPW